MADLTHKQQAFVEHYLRTWNATEAARQAGYSARSAQQIGAENLSKPVIQEAIQARLSELKMSADEVLLRLADTARGSMRDFLRVDAEEITVELSVALLSDVERDRLLLQGVTAVRELLDTGDASADKDAATPAKAVRIQTATITRNVARLDLLKASDKLHLIKRYSLDDKGKVSIELYDAHAAQVKIGEHHQLFGKTDLLKHLDLSTLDDAQLERVAAGEDPIRVLIGNTTT